jgi:hypothetical protein
MMLGKYDQAAPTNTKSEGNCRTEAVAALTALLGKSDDLCKKVLKHCRGELPEKRAIEFGRDELCYYYYTQTVFMLDVDSRQDFSWMRYRESMFDQLQKNQKKDGSWPASNGLAVDPVYSTALWCIIMQLDKENHRLARLHSVVLR